MDWEEIKRARDRLAGEQGTIIKDWGGKIPVALLYPNSYYIGMSNLGVHAIYTLLNSHSDFICERAFWEQDKKIKQSPLAIESQRPLTDFAAIAFSISYELDYLNIARILKASGIPLYAADRDESHPLVIAGGACIMTNPMPVSPFFDCLCIGEAEAILPGMLPVLAEGIQGERSDLLKSLAALPGIYVPQYHSGSTIARQWTANLDDFPVASAVITADTELGDLYLIEVERGCNWACRFCLVSSAYQPIRYRSLDNLLAQAKEGLKYRRRLGLMGPAVTAHPQIEELLDTLCQMGAGLSVSSLRIKPLPSHVVELLAESGAENVTLAPEAGSERLRKLIRKGFSEDDILEAVDKVAEQRIKQLKLYFMLGLPTETDEDVEEIVKLAAGIKKIIEKHHSGCRININVAPFVPKAGTPFQWLPMTLVPVLNRRITMLKNSLPRMGIKLNAESPPWSEVQAVLSRGDAKLAEVLANVEEVSLPGWRRAVEKCRLDTDYYAYQRWDAKTKLPWSIIESGVQDSS